METANDKNSHYMKIQIIRGLSVWFFSIFTLIVRKAFEKNVSMMMIEM